MKNINSYIEKFESKMFLIYENEYKKTNILSQQEKYNKDIKFDIQESNTPKFL